MRRGNKVGDWLKPPSPALPSKVKGAQHRKILDVQFIIKAKN